MSMTHVLALNIWTWPRGDVPGLELTDEDVSLLRGWDVTLGPGLKRINGILISTSCNFFSGSLPPKNHSKVKLAWLGKI
jgi:hypothetical protein